LRPDAYQGRRLRVERQVLEGGAALLLSQPAPLLWLELHNRMLRERGHDPRKLGLLDDLGYSIFSQRRRAMTRNEILAHPLVRVVCKKT